MLNGVVGSGAITDKLRPRRLGWSGNAKGEGHDMREPIADIVRKGFVNLTPFAADMFLLQDEHGQTC
jgi:hypothetical protein